MTPVIARISTLVIAAIVTIAIVTSMASVVYSSTIEVPTYDPPMSYYGKINGTKILDYTGSEDMSFLMVPHYNLTVMVDVSDYNDCLATPNLLNTLTETDPTLASMTHEEQERRIMDHCVADHAYL